MAVPYASRDYTVGMAEQTTWGTAVADNAAVIQLDVDPIHLPQPLNFRTNPGATGARWRVTTDYAVDQYGVATEFTIKGEAKQKELDLLLAGYFQKCVEGALTPYSKVFTFDTAAPQPDFATGNAGYTLTFFFRDPVAADSWKVKDCIVKSLKLTFQPNQRCQYEAVIVGRGAPATSTPSGTWTRSANEFWFWNLCAAKTVDFGSGAVAQILGSGGLELNLTQQVELYGQESTGDGTSWILWDRFPKFSFNCLKGTSLATAITNLKAATAADVVWRWGNATPGTDNGDLNFSFKCIFTPDIERVFGNNYEMNLQGDIASANNSTTPITVTLANATDRTW